MGYQTHRKHIPGPNVLTGFGMNSATALGAMESIVKLPIVGLLLIAYAHSFMIYALSLARRLRRLCLNRNNIHGQVEKWALLHGSIV